MESEVEMRDGDLASLMSAWCSELVRYPYGVWHYGDSIGLEGLDAAAGMLGRRDLRAWPYGLLRGWAARLQPPVERDNTVPGRLLCEIALREDDSSLVSAALTTGQFLSSRPTLADVFVSFERACLIPPHGDAALSAVEVRLLHEPGRGIYVDCMDLEPGFFLALSALDRAGGWGELGIRQCLSWIAALQEESGLMAHFLLERDGRRYGYGWGRGQGWALRGLGDVLVLMSRDDPRRGPLLDGYRRLADAMAGLQRPDGGWFNVVHDPGSGEETSTAAFMAADFARGVNEGWLSASYGARAISAWKWFLTQCHADGRIDGVSVAVWSSTAASHYVHVPRGGAYPWGQGIACLAACELVRAGLVSPVIQ